MANATDFIVKSGLVVKATTTVPSKENLVITNVVRTASRPSLDINFTRSNSLDSRITFSRNSGATYINQQGYISYAAINQPRFDYDPLTNLSKGLLVEEFRTNLLLYTTGISSNGWGNTNCSNLQNAVIAPDNTLTGSKIVEANTTGNKEFQQTINVTAGTYYTVSVFAKAAERDTFRIGLSTGAFAGSTNVYFQLSGSGSIPLYSGGYTTATIQAYSNGWYRCSGTFLPTTTTSMSAYLTLSANTGSTNTSYQGDGVSGLYYWGAQIEAGYFATTFIPTGSAQASRATETCAIVGQNYNSVFNGTQGSFYVEADNTYNTAKTDYPRVLAFCDINGNQNNTIQYIYYTATGGAQVAVWRGGNYLNAVNTNVASGALVKAAFGYNQTTITGSFNGSVSQSGSIPGLPTLDRLGIGTLPYGGGGINGHIKKFTYWPQKLPDAQLQIMTS
jgi:hypothetical protein